MKLFSRLRERELFLTHTPTAWKVGQLYDLRDGETYRITRIRRLSNTRLLSGGSTPCFQVKGVRA